MYYATHWDSVLRICPKRLFRSFWVRLVSLRVSWMILSIFSRSKGATLESFCNTLLTMSQADSYVSLKRSVLHPSRSMSCQTSAFRTSSRLVPHSSGTKVHIVVTMTTFGIVFWPHKPEDFLSLSRTFYYQRSCGDTRRLRG